VPRFGRPQDVRGGNTKSIRSIAFSCDGRKVATGTEYKGLRIWNAAQPVSDLLLIELKKQMEASGSYSLPKVADSSPHNGHVGLSNSSAK
jgi:THO complex subunit 3